MHVHTTQIVTLILLNYIAAGILATATVGSAAAAATATAGLVVVVVVLLLLLGDTALSL